MDYAKYLGILEEVADQLKMAEISINADVADRHLNMAKSGLIKLTHKINSNQVVVQKVANLRAKL